MRRNVFLGAMLWAFQSGMMTAMAVHPAPDPEPQKPLFQWIFSLVMVGLICVIAFKNPKRSHQS